jgi:hypothetical protein
MDEIIVEECVVERVIDPSNILISVLTVFLEPKLISSTLELLANVCPLEQFNLTHIKRVRKALDMNQMIEVAVAPSSFESSLPVSVIEIVKNAIERRHIQVAKYAPQTIKEFNEWTAIWPVSFHVSEIERQRKKGLSHEEKTQIHLHYEQLLLEHVKIQNLLPHVSGAILIDPQSNQILCTTSQAINYLIEKYGLLSVQEHPLLSPTLLCIDHLSYIARGELSGIEQLPFGFYLCTGFDLYLYQEADIMAAMALVHSRIRRVFFCERNHHQEGAFISSSYHIHCLPSLNHHYRVFQIQSSNTSSIVAGASTVTHSENTILSSTLGPTTSTASTSLAESFSSTDETS